MKKILIIDDEPTITEIIGLYAGRLGYASDCAGSGDEAVEKLKKSCYWAVFCDLRMPGLNGIEIYHKIRETASCTPEQFVLLTGSMLDDELQNLVEKKDILVFHKPFNLEGISNTFHKLESRAARSGQKFDVA